MCTCIIIRFTQYCCIEQGATKQTNKKGSDCGTTDKNKREKVKHYMSTAMLVVKIALVIENKQIVRNTPSHSATLASSLLLS